jgi:uncharacterized membrane protein
MTKRTEERPSLLAKLRSYLLSGLLVMAPIVITLYIVGIIVTFADNFLKALIPSHYLPNYYLPFDIPGLGLIAVILLLILIGALVTGFFGKLLVHLSERLLHKTPVVRSIYSGVKQVFVSLLESKSSTLKQVALIEFPRKGIWALGFVTGTTKGEVQEDTEEEVLNVFVPTTPNPTSGFLVFIPRKEITFLEMTVEEGIKMVISGGIITPAHVELNFAKKKKKK